jgi:hypothetical protein
LVSGVIYASRLESASLAASSKDAALVERDGAVVAKAEADERGVPLAQQLESMQSALAAAEARIAEQREELGGKPRHFEA